MEHDRVACEARLSHHDRQQRAVDALQVADQIGLDAITRRADRATFEQRIRSKSAALP